MLSIPAETEYSHAGRHIVSSSGEKFLFEENGGTVEYTVGNGSRRILAPGIPLAASADLSVVLTGCCAYELWIVVDGVPFPVALRDARDVEVHVSDVWMTSDGGAALVEDREQIGAGADFRSHAYFINIREGVIEDLGNRAPLGIVDGGATAILRDGPDSSAGDLVEYDVASGTFRPWRGAGRVAVPSSGTGVGALRQSLSQDGRYYSTYTELDGGIPFITRAAVSILDLETGSVERVERQQVAPGSTDFTVLEYEYGLALIQVHVNQDGSNHPALLYDTVTKRSYVTPPIHSFDTYGDHGMRVLSRDGIFLGLFNTTFPSTIGQPVPVAIQLADITNRPLPSGQTLEVQVTGRAGIPWDAEAVVLNMTAVNAHTDGFATVYPCGEPRPDASNLNFAAGQTTPNLVIAKPGIDGKVCIYSYAAIDVLADVAGYFPAGTDFTPIPNPTRILDTRNAIGV